jgi:hypothetical protein
MARNDFPDREKYFRPDFYRRPLARHSAFVGSARSGGREIEFLIYIFRVNLRDAIKYLPFIEEIQNKDAGVRYRLS